MDLILSPYTDARFEADVQRITEMSIMIKMLETHAADLRLMHLRNIIDHSAERSCREKFEFKDCAVKFVQDGPNNAARSFGLQRQHDYRLG
jgi:hypothetical protein